MKRLFCLLAVLLMLLCGCSDKQTYTHSIATENQSEKLVCGSDNEFIPLSNGNLLSPSGTEYTFLATEGDLYHFGELEFQGSVRGEAQTPPHLVLGYPTGLFSIKDVETDNILIRHCPNDEWFHIYRKASLPPLDSSADNCIRLELVLSSDYLTGNDLIHTTCGDGITDKAEIAEFLSDIRSQDDPHTAGLYDMIKKPNGMLENCYIYAVIYGFFEDEPNLAVRMEITSYNDLAYSVCIEGKEYVLPEAWLERLQDGQTQTTEAVFNTENIDRITLYAYYGYGKGSEVPAEDMTEIVNWLGSFAVGEKAPDVSAPGTNTYVVEIEYSDGTIIKQGLDVIVIDETFYYLKSDNQPDCFMEIISKTSLE